VNKNILAVCVGNICRSPIAEGLLRKALPDCTIISAGIGVLIGAPADQYAVRVMQEQAIDISGHRAQQLAGWMVEQADLILTMDLDQKRYVETRYPTATGKVFRMGSFGRFDIGDPYRQDFEGFRSSYRLIAQGVEYWVEQLLQIR
jgi:protein-tyrosine phosphatase